MASVPRSIRLLALAAFFLPTLAITALASFRASDWHADLLAWRAQRAKQLCAPDGWLTLVGLDWLQSGQNSVGSGPDNRIRLSGSAPGHLGVLSLQGSQMRLLAPAQGFPSALLVDGQPARPVLVRVDGDHPTVLRAGSLTLVVIHRGDRYALRVKDAQSLIRLTFHGLRWFAPNAKYRVEARWIPWTPPHTEKIPTIIGTTLDLPAPGVAEFTLAGQTFQLEPVLEEPGAKQLFFILRDTTSHTTSYGAGRFLYTDFPDHGLDHPGHLPLDFNRLQNPPCAYTPYATCPLPPPGNRLNVALPVGEQRYSH